jgi:hypothetical protein
MYNWSAGVNVKAKSLGICIIIHIIRTLEHIKYGDICFIFW